MEKLTQFGVYLKELRVSAGTEQEDLANAVGKTKQYISNLERGVNLSPPEDSDLELYCQKLLLDDEQKEQFYFKAAADRGRLPKKQMEYILNHDYLIQLIAYGEKHHTDEQTWKMLIEVLKLQK